MPAIDAMPQSGVGGIVENRMVSTSSGGGGAKPSQTSTSSFASIPWTTLSLIEKRPDNKVVESKVAKLEETVSGLPSKADITELRTEFSNLRADFAELRADLKAGLSDFKAEMHKNSIDLHRWMQATAVGLFIGFGGLFLAMSNGLKQQTPSAAAQQPAPVIITMPQPQAPAAQNK